MLTSPQFGSVWNRPRPGLANRKVLVMPSGKKSEKMHIRLTEDVAREVRATADLDHRPIQDQIRYLLVLGLKVLRSGVQVQDDVIRRTVPPVATTHQQDLPLGAPPIAAKSRTAPREKRFA